MMLDKRGINTRGVDGLDEPGPQIAAMFDLVVGWIFASRNFEHEIVTRQAYAVTFRVFLAGFIVISNERRERSRRDSFPVAFGDVSAGSACRDEYRQVACLLLHEQGIELPFDGDNWQVGQ